MKISLLMEQREKKEIGNQLQGNAWFAYTLTVPGHVYY